MLVGRCFSIYSKRKISVSGQLGSDRLGGHCQVGPGLTWGEICGEKSASKIKLFLTISPYD